MHGNPGATLPCMDLTSADTERLAALFRHFANVECPEEPLYEALCRSVAEDPALLDLLSGAIPEQQRPNLWLAAVHDLLLRGETHALGAYFPSVGGDRTPDADLPQHVRDFARQHEPALRQLMATRTTQTNEIGRSAVLWPALHGLAARAGRSEIALLDLGCSAGLNLSVDQFTYGHAPTQPGRPHLSARTFGPHQPATSPTPRIVQRCGIDPTPVRADDEAGVRWLRACLWPSDRVRATRFDQAVALMREHRWQVERVADCTAYVEGWLASVPAGVQPVVFNSWVLTYFEAAARQRHIDTMTALVQRTGAMWLSAEGPWLRLGGVEPPAPVSPTLASGSLWTLCSRQNGEARFELIARSHPHGAWVEWLGAAAVR